MYKRKKSPVSAGRGGHASPDIPLSVVLADGLQQMGLRLPEEAQASVFTNSIESNEIR